MTQYQHGEEGEGKGDTRKLKMGWGTGFSKGRHFSHHTQQKPPFPHFVKGRQVLREENWE